MSDYETIRLETKGPVATVTLNRPDKLNAYMPQMGEEIVDAFANIRVDNEVRVVILTGEGRGFCAGVDLEALRASQTGGAESAKAPKLGEEAFLRTFPLELAEFPKPVIAAINGAAIGVGVTMALPCDIRIASDKAKLGMTFTKLGILPGLGSTHLLPKIIGLSRALEFVLSARVVGAAEALELGLVSRVVPGDRLLDEATALAEQIAECNPHATALAKRLLHQGASSSMSEAMKQERSAGSELRPPRG